MAFYHSTSHSSGSRRGQVAPGGLTLTRCPSYMDLGDEDEDFVDENDEQSAGSCDPVSAPQKDLMSRLANRSPPSRSPPRYDVPTSGNGTAWAPAVRQTGTGRGTSVRAAVSKFQYLADASASTPNFSAPKPSAPIPIPRNPRRQEIVSSGLGLALSAPAGGSVVDLRESESLRSHNPHLKMVNGELRMAVFPERRGTFAGASGQRFVQPERTHSVPQPPVVPRPVERDIRSTSPTSPSESGSATSSPRQKPARPPLPNPVDIAALRSRPSVSKASSPVPRTPEPGAPEVHARAEAPGERPKSFVSVIPRNHVANIVGELKFVPTTPSNLDHSEKKTSKWAPVDTSATLKRKWEPGSRFPATIRSYMNFFSGASTQASPMTRVK